MSENAIEALGNIGDNVKIHTHYRVREDDISIFGFDTLEELKMFELLLGVSGIGAKTALSTLAICEPSEFALAIVSEDVKTLTQIPGIGPKSAKRIILELKDKIKMQQEVEAIKNQIDKNQNENATAKIQQALENQGKAKEAIEALQVLGYNKKEIEKTFEKINIQELSTEEIIKQGLKLLGNQ